MVSLLQFILTVLVVGTFATAALSEKRVALVVGNANYQHVGSLANPIIDSRGMREALEKLHFEVVYGEDLDKRSLERRIAEFATKVKDADVAIVYFAGHGSTFGDIPYVVPVDAEYKTLEQVPHELVQIEALVGELRRARGVRIAILDACRDNEAEINLKRKATRGTGIARGLARIKNPQGLIVAYATQHLTTANDGAPGRNSPFTASLLRHITSPDLDIKELFFTVAQDVIEKTGGGQHPEISISLFQKYALVRPPSRPSVPSTPVRPAVGAFPTTLGFTPLPVERERSLKPKETFKECDWCPEMVVIPAGSFTMGSPASEKDRGSDEGPQHRVTFARQFAVGKFAVTFDNWDACVADGGCNGYRPGDRGWGRGRRPVINVSWDAAKDYVAWLSKTTGKTYRLLSEAEREYVTRAGTTTPFWWGSSVSTTQANYDGNSSGGDAKSEYRQKTVPVDSFAPNPWGLYQVHGNVSEWTEDCYKDSYSGVPTDGSAWTMEDCSRRVLRGGSWYHDPGDLRSAKRDNRYSTRDRYGGISFRVARTLTP